MSVGLPNLGEYSALVKGKNLIVLGHLFLYDPIELFTMFLEEEPVVASFRKMVFEAAQRDAAGWYLDDEGDGVVTKAVDDGGALGSSAVAGPATAALAVATASTMFSRRPMLLSHGGPVRTGGIAITVATAAPSSAVNLTTIAGGDTSSIATTIAPSSLHRCPRSTARSTIPTVAWHSCHSGGGGSDGCRR